MRKYKVSIIGSGNIVSGYDFPDSLDCLTHCHSLKNINDFEIVGVFDKNEKILKETETKWNVKTFNSFEELMSHNTDVVVIAVPNIFHEYYLEKLLDYNIKLVLCEKPLTIDIHSSEIIVKKYKRKKIELVVCYQRRYDDDFNDLKNKFKSDKIGKLINGVVLYSKGFLHNGSHAVDILRYIFGEILNSFQFESKIDYSNLDPTISAFFEFENGNITFLASNEIFHSLFEIDLIFEKARYRFYDSGFKLDIYNVSEDIKFNGYSALNIVESRKSTLNYSLLNMWKEILLFLKNGNLLKTTSLESLKTQITCLSINKI